MRLRLARSCFGILVSIGILSSCICAQTSQMDVIADQMASALSHSRAGTIVVFDFTGPDGMEALGQQLAVDFSAALTKSANSFHVETRSQLVEALQNHGLVPGSVRDAETASWYLRETGVDVLVLGTISKGMGGLAISVEAYNVADSAGIAQFGTSGLSQSNHY